MDRLKDGDGALRYFDKSPQEPIPGGGNRTRTTFRSTDFKSVASAVPPRPVGEYFNIRRADGHWMTQGVKSNDLCYHLGMNTLKTMRV